ncbi:hypothetical protein [Pseudomonas sp. Ant30-3]|uniref:hypothetical protein n=1 Tax=Pseudomonas sp. Ant30-3 TaxID=1488328 RepID=UPI0015A635C4|nr:hypothetical protein [Pseudomonas sp. Ant30-3]
MLASRCNDRFPADGDQTLSSIREQLKLEMKARSFLANRHFEVWINEDAPAADGMQNGWDACCRRSGIVMCCFCCLMAIPGGIAAFSAVTPMLSIVINNFFALSCHIYR